MANVINASNLQDAIDMASNYMVPRADLKVDVFDTLIQQKGYRILWEQGMFCSCYTTISGQPDYNCPVCKGKGYVYFDPKEIRAIVTSINGHREQQHIGLQDMGTAYLTPPSVFNVGFRDRFTFLDFTTKYSEVITRGYDSYDRLRYPAKDIIAVRNLNDTYMRGTDFNLSKDERNIEWITYPMNESDNYSILYTINPVYIAIGPIHELRGTYTTSKMGGMEAFNQLPKQFQIKREDFIDGDEVQTGN